jgi:sulfate adenylyltransferase
MVNNVESRPVATTIPRPTAAPPSSRLLSGPAAYELLNGATNWPSWTLTSRQSCDLELLLCGGFAPLDGFMDRATYESVCSRMRLPDGQLWPIPVMLDVPDDIVGNLEMGGHLALRNQEGTVLAVVDVTAWWRPDRRAEAEMVFGTSDPGHPGVAHLLQNTHPWYVAGTLTGLRLPKHDDYRDLRLSPEQVRAETARLGWSATVAFQTRNPLHRAHLELTSRAMEATGAGLLLHPVVGLTKPGDVDHYTRVRCYRAAMSHYRPGTALLALLPLAMRMAGPREALWHAIIRRNYGADHFIVGRDHAGPGQDANGQPYYDPYAAQELVQQHQDEIGIQVVPFRQMVYLPDQDRYQPEDEVPPGIRTLALSGTEQRRLLQTGERLPSWFTPPEVASELYRRYPSRQRQGCTIFFTGLPTSGKSTLANAVLAHLLEHYDRTVTILDGDIVRTYLSSELGFSREHRDLNVKRIGYVAAEITKHGGIALCAAIAPFADARGEVRRLVEPHGGFVLVHVDSPVETCESRDHKGHYAKARAGVIKGFTGVNDTYEVPVDAELTLDSGSQSIEECVATLLTYLRNAGYLTAIQPEGN